MSHLKIPPGVSEHLVKQLEQLQEQMLILIQNHNVSIFCFHHLVPWLHFIHIIKHVDINVLIQPSWINISFFHLQILKDRLKKDPEASRLELCIYVRFHLISNIFSHVSLFVFSFFQDSLSARQLTYVEDYLEQFNEEQVRLHVQDWLLI